METFSSCSSDILWCCTADLTQIPGLCRWTAVFYTCNFQIPISCAYKLIQSVSNISSLVSGICESLYGLQRSRSRLDTRVDRMVAHGATGKEISSRRSVARAVPGHAHTLMLSMGFYTPLPIWLYSEGSYIHFHLFQHFKKCSSTEWVLMTAQRISYEYN